MINIDQLQDVMKLLNNDYKVSFMMSFNKGDIANILIYDDEDMTKEPLVLDRTYLIEQEDIKPLLEKVVRQWKTGKIIEGNEVE